MSLPNRDLDLLALNQSLLNSAVAGDWSTYTSLCSEDVSCFEMETDGVLVEGLPFHRYYFELPSAPTHVQSPSPVTVTMARPHLRWLSDDAVVLSYTRLTQRLIDGAAATSSCCETRIWQRRDGRWQQVHLHRS